MIYKVYTKLLLLIVGAVCLVHNAQAGRYLVINRSYIEVKLFFTIIGAPSRQTRWLRPGERIVLDIDNHDVWLIKVRSRGLGGVSQHVGNLDADRDYVVSVTQEAVSQHIFLTVHETRDMSNIVKNIDLL